MRPPHRMPPALWFLAAALVPPSALAQSDPQSLATALAQACPSAGGALAARCAELGALGPQALPQALVALSPYQFLPQIAVPLKIWPKQVSIRQPPGLDGAAQGEWSSRRKGSGAGDAAGGDEAWGWFAQAKYQGGAYHQAPAQFKADAYSLTLGGDYRFSGNLVSGLAFIYTRQETPMRQNPGHMQTDAYRAAWFGNYYLPAAFYLDWLATYSRHDNQISRNYSFPGFAGKAESAPGNDLYTFALTVGRDWDWGAWSLASYVRTESMNLHIEPYSERGGQGLAYQVGGQSDQSLTVTPGLQLNHALGFSWGVLTPALRFEYEHQFENDNRAIALRLAEAAPGTGYFTLHTGDPDRDYFNLGGSLAATLPGGNVAFLRYEARLGQAHISNDIVEVGIRGVF